MLKVGITGGIGSGKTTVCQIFSQLGIPIFNADQAVKDLYANHSGLKIQLQSAFGSEVYTPTNQINIPFLKGLLLSPEKTEKPKNRKTTSRRLFVTEEAGSRDPRAEGFRDRENNEARNAGESNTSVFAFTT